MASANFSQKIKIEQIKLLYQQITFGLWAESCAAISLFAVLWGNRNPTILVSWLLFNLIVSGLGRHVLVYCYKHWTNKHGYPYRFMRLWLALFTLGAFLSGVSWGLAGSLLMVKGDMVRQTFVVLLLMGVTSAANAFYSPVRSVFVAFILPAFVPFALWLIWQGDIFIVLGLLAFVYVVIMIATSIHTNNLIHHSLLLRFENVDLVEDLFEQANFDSLTGLPSRALLRDRISHAIAYARKAKMELAILFLDLDRFKLINDTLGHGIADKLLVAVAKRLIDSVDENATISREAGDEFIIILNFENEAEIINKAGKLLQVIREPFLIDGRRINTTISIGISFFPKDGEDPETLLKKADIAMYHAKTLGRNNFQFFTEEMNKKVLNRLVMENQLRNALEQDEFSLLYQPIVDLKTGKITAMEALLRWSHPKKVSIPPADFITIAEETGLIIPIGDWTLRKACKDLKFWQKKGFTDLQIAVNLSHRQFKQSNLVNEIKQILIDTQIDPHSLTLELTESIVMEDVDKTIEVLDQLKNMGVTIVIDDFGTGYSSLNYLKQLPVDKLKIDKSFIEDIPQHTDDAAITSAIIALAARLEIKVIAEGVEKEEQLKFLMEHHCDEIQGFYFATPLNAEDCVALLHKNKMTPFSSLVL